jgi:hypothetical protein
LLDNFLRRRTLVNYFIKDSNSDRAHFRHCERSEAIHNRHECGLPRRFAPRNDKEHTRLNSDLMAGQLWRGEAKFENLQTISCIGRGAFSPCPRARALL